MSMGLLPYFVVNGVEAGCDEAGRGCLAGPVVAAAVVLPTDFYHPLLNDSKKVSEKDRRLLRVVIEREALDWKVAFVSASEIDTYNILQASFMAMHRAIEQLGTEVDRLLIDGNRFVPYQGIPNHCIIKGDSKYTSIAAASILAKTWRDEYMEELHHLFPQYGWNQNKGYPTKLHREAIKDYGHCSHHRLTFRLLPETTQLELF
jgi:ribonuclease HII